MLETELSVLYRFVAPAGTRSVEVMPLLICRFVPDEVILILFPAESTLLMELTVAYRFVAPGGTRSAELIALLIRKLPPDEVIETLFPAESRLLMELSVEYKFVAPCGRKSVETTPPPLPPAEAMNNLPLDEVIVMLFPAARRLLTERRVEYKFVVP
jgi:hypothetical protein